ncbi:hypothetical protein MSP8886_00508 [Marinomonas spartinae]|uniref:Uncharacterized protein n=1 Tax=Marinomonas spartinae TaxID=1792290 RepID=A0A1A8T3W3_9GAMM|nr:hypothetical protein [Marinomonas spartinae]SBS26132.1 hypothetical protein MSP8886_00508 [Marinomonas spartinae]
MDKKHHTKPSQPASFEPTEKAYKELEESFKKARTKASRKGSKPSRLDFVEIIDKK